MADLTPLLEAERNKTWAAIATAIYDGDDSRYEQTVDAWFDLYPRTDESTAGLDLLSRMAQAVAQAIADENGPPVAMRVTDPATGLPVNPDSVDDAMRPLVIVGRAVTAAGTGADPIDHFSLLASDDETIMCVKTFRQLLHDTLHLHDLPPDAP